MTNLLKSLFISAYIGGSATALVWSLVQAWHEGFASGWTGAALSAAGPVAFFASVFALPRARTSRDLHGVLAANAGGALLAASGAGVASAAFAVAAAFAAATLLYVRWYSRFAAPTAEAVRAGAVLPSFTLTENGRRVASDELVGRPALWVFYRGNWCPVCVAQIQEICAQYRELARRGIEVFFVSPQPEENSGSLAARCNAPMRFLTDAGNAVAARLGILEKHGLPAGMQMLGYDSDVPRPTVILTGPGGRVIHCDMTDNYRVRPEPGQFLEIFDRAA